MGQKVLKPKFKIVCLSTMEPVSSVFNVFQLFYTKMDPVFATKFSPKFGWVKAHGVPLTTTIIFYIRENLGLELNY